MPPRFAYWTILLDGKPTAFRAAEQGELLPTFKRLQEKHPDAVMRWFARGKLWSSPEEARSETARRAEAADAEARGRNWRPGGSHRDPRQPYKDAKKQRNQERRQRRFEYRAKDDPFGGSSKGRPPKKDWNKAVAPESRERMPWTERAKPAGRWPRDERQGGPGPKTDNWKPRPTGPRESRPWNKPGGGPHKGDRVEPESRKPWPNQEKPEHGDRPPFRGARRPSERPPFKKSRDSGFGGNGRGKAPRGPKR